MNAARVSPWLGSVLVVAALAACAVAQPPGRGRGMGQGGPGRGMRSDPTFADDRETFHDLLGDHDKVERTVTPLPNGVRTRTTSEDPELAAKISEHVAAMYARMKENRPVRRWDPLFAALFDKADQVEIDVKPIDGGVEVTETSADPETAALIRAHAETVSRFVEHGFAEAQRAHPLPTNADVVAVIVEPAAEGPAKQVVALSAEFDQRYIPALALTNQGKGPPSVQMLKRLQAALPLLESRLSASEGGGVDLLAGVAGMVAESLELASEGELQEAHETLEPIRDLLASRRRAAGVAYPLDVLSDYHAVMESIVKPATAMSPDALDDAERRRIADAAASASQVWAVAEQTDFAVEDAPPGWPGVDKVAEGVSAVRGSITDLNTALRSRDAQAILRTAVALKPPFAKLYMSFGDLPKPGAAP